VSFPLQEMITCQMQELKRNPSTYKLMEKAGYDFENPTTLGKVVEANSHGLNVIQRKIQE